MDVRTVLPCTTIIEEGCSHRWEVFSLAHEHLTRAELIITILHEILKECLIELRLVAAKGELRREEWIGNLGLIDSNYYI